MFSDKYGLTQAVLELRKKNTRRQEKSLDNAIEKYEETYKTPFSIISQYYDSGLERLVLRTPDEAIYIKPRYLPGEVVAVAQKYSDIMPYLADSFHQPSIDYMKNKPGYNNKLFVRADLMPHQIRVTDIRVERIQDISNEDCLREGIYLDKTAPPCCRPFYTFQGSQECGTLVGYHTAREAYEGLITQLSSKITWDDNPYVFVYTFELVK